MPDSTSSANRAAGPHDLFGRALRELRVSVTDRCNFRCGYCMPEADAVRFMPRAELLTFEEIARAARLFVEHMGVRKIRLTGGEPLVRRDLPRLVDLLARIEGVDEIALTTNGTLLAQQAGALARAGLDRVTVSLDALDEPTFRRACGADTSPARVLDGISAATEAGLGHAKINCVVQRDVNEHAIEDLARRFRGTPHVVRFIEYMDVGTVNGWALARVITADEILARLSAIAPLARLDSASPGGTSERYTWQDGAGEVGVVASVSRPFCGACDRARLSADGRLMTCLFAETGPTLRDALRTGASDDTISAIITTAWRARDDRYSERRKDLRERAPLRRLEMYQIGG